MRFNILINEYELENNNVHFESKIDLCLYCNGHAE